MNSLIKLAIIAAVTIVVLLIIAGIFKAFLKILAVILSIAIAVVLSPYVSDFLTTYTPVDDYIYDVAYAKVQDKISDRINDFLDSAGGSSEELTVEDYKKYIENSDKKGYDIGLSFFVENALKQETVNIFDQKAIDSLSDMVAGRVTDYFMGIISGVAVYLICAAIIQGIRTLIGMHKKDRDR